MSPKVDYLIIGDQGSSNWAFSCYGRKVVQAVNLRKQGHPMKVVHEDEFWHALKNKGLVACGMLSGKVEGRVPECSPPEVTI